MENLSGKSFPFSITKKDYENSGRDFMDIEDCPFLQAVKRQFPSVNIYTVGVMSINAGTLANIEPGFYDEDFERLKNGIEFHTTITFI